MSAPSRLTGVGSRDISTDPLAPPPSSEHLTPSDCSVSALRASGRAIRPLTSPNDDREHLIFVLPNGLRVCVVSDPAAAQAACAVGVHVGHQSDGHIPGAAHFAEHLCFMGSDKYPNENDFASFLSQNGGGSNASTGGQATTYHCRITPSQLRPALSRLSRFFIAPLFQESTIAREAHAVHNEWSKNLPSDSRRSYHLDKATSNPLHPYSQFGSGNAHTLHDLKAARAAVVALWERFYTAENMSVAVVGTEGVDVLRRWVEEEFAEVRATSKGEEAVQESGLPDRYGAHPLLSNPLRRASLPQQEALAALAGAVPTMNAARLYPSKSLEGDDDCAAADAAAITGATGASADPEVEALLASSRPAAAAPVPSVAGCNTTDLQSEWRPSVATNDPELAKRVLRGAPKEGSPVEDPAPSSAAEDGVPSELIRAFPGSEGAIITWTPNQDRRVLELLWVIPPQGAWPGSRSGASSLLGYLIGDEGPGSLLAVLKSKGLASSVSAGCSGSQQADYTSFAVEVVLTEAGLRSMWAVVAHVYWCIGLVSAASDGELVKQHTTMARLRELSFRFMSRPNPEASAKSLASLLRSFPASSPPRALDGPDPSAAAAAAAAREDLRYATCTGMVLDSFEPAHVRRILRCLTPGRARVNVSAKNFSVPDGAEKAMELREVHYGTEYRRDVVPAWALRLCQKAYDTAVGDDAGADAGAGAGGDEDAPFDPSAFAELALPIENVFVPTDFTIVEAEPEPLFANTPGKAANEAAAVKSFAESLVCAVAGGPEWAQSARCPTTCPSPGSSAAMGVVPLRPVEEVLSWRAPVIAEGGVLGPAPSLASVIAADAAAAGASPDAASGSAESIPRTLCSDPRPPRLLLRPTSALRLWHRTDRIHRDPRTHINVVALTSALPIVTIDDTMRLNFFISLVCDALNKQTYAAGSAGLSMSLSHASAPGGVGGICVSVGGYSQTVGKLLEVVLHEITHHTVNPTHFALHKERFIRVFQNAALAVSPQDQASNAIELLLGYGVCSSETRAARFRAIEAITESDLRAVAAAFAAAPHSTEAGGFAVAGFVEMGVFGNASRADALALAKIVAKSMPGCVAEDAEPADWVKALLPAAVCSEGTDCEPDLSTEYKATVAADIAAAAAASDAAAAAGISDGAASVFAPCTLMRVPPHSAAGKRAVAAAATAAAGAGNIDTAAPLLLPHLHPPACAASAAAATPTPAPPAPVRTRAAHAHERLAWQTAKRVVALDAGEAAMVRLQSTNPKDANSAIRVYFQLLAPAPKALLTNMPRPTVAGKSSHSAEEQWLRVYAAVAVLSKMVREPCFNALRAKQALAYIVHAGLSGTDAHISGTALLGSGVPGMVFVVQSTSHSAAQLQRRLHGFLRDFRSTLLADMTEETFLKYVNSTIESVVTQGGGSGAVVAAPTPRAAASALWSEVRRGRADFDFAPERLLPHVRALTREHMRVFFDEYILPPVGEEPGPHRRVLSMQVEHQRHVPVFSPGSVEGGSDETPVPEDGDWDPSLWATTVVPPDDEGLAWWKATHSAVAKPAMLFSKLREHERWGRLADAAVKEEDTVE